VNWRINAKYMGSISVIDSAGGSIQHTTGIGPNKQPERY